MSIAWTKISKAYKLQGRTTFQGLDISIENKKGSVRRWYDPHGKEKGSTKMHFDYGYIRRTKGTDGDHVDVYIGPNPEATTAFIVNQMKKPEGEIKKDGKAWTKFDEQKVMLGFDSAKDAKAAYMKQYDDPRFFGSMKAMPMEEFISKVLRKDNHGKKVAELFLNNPNDPLHIPPTERKKLRKKASGDMLQYFADNPKKYEEWKARREAKERRKAMKKTSKFTAGDKALLAAATVGPGVGFYAALPKHVKAGIKDEVRDPRLYSNIRGMASGESRAERVDAHKKLDMSKKHTVGSAIRSGFTRKKASDEVLLYAELKLAGENLESIPAFTRHADYGKDMEGMGDRDRKKKVAELAKEAVSRGWVEKMVRSGASKAKKPRLQKFIGNQAKAVEKSVGNVGQVQMVPRVAKRNAALLEAVKHSSKLTPKQEAIAERLDDVGIGLLAAPYAADAVSKLKNRPGALGAVGKGAVAAKRQMVKHEIPMELTGLGLVAPGITNNLAKGVDKAKAKLTKKSELDKFAHDNIPDYEYMTEMEKQAIISFLKRTGSAALKGLRGGVSAAGKKGKALDRLGRIQSKGVRPGAGAGASAAAKAPTKAPGSLITPKRLLVGGALVGTGAGLYTGKKVVDTAAARLDPRHHRERQWRDPSVRGRGRVF